jgi:hypothetical protein
MERATAYLALATELEAWRQKGPGQLRALAGLPPAVRHVDLGGEIVDVEVSVSWVDATQQNLRVEAVANGPSNWETERLVERVIVPVNNPT